MKARPAIATVKPGGWRAAPLSFTDWGYVEVLKWTGLAAMLVEHAALAFGAEPHGWAFQVGRLAFPLFLYSFALAMAGASRKKALRAASRLLPFAVAAQLVVGLVRAEPLLNVLFLFVCLLAWLAADDLPKWQRYLVKALCLLVMNFTEFHFAGLAMGIGLVRTFERESLVWPALAGSAFALNCFVDQTPAAVAAVSAGLLIAACGIRAPRVRFLLPGLYVAQWPVLAVLQRVL